jgi:hypothetical protein
MNRERAEAHLRLVAEAELRRATTRTVAPPAVLGQRAAVAAALHGMPRIQREAVVLRYYLDLSEAETACMIGISVGAVRAHSARGVAELQAALQADTTRVARVAQVLTAARALGQETADQILDDFALAVGLRRAGSRGQRGQRRQDLRSRAPHLPLAMLMNTGPPAASMPDPPACIRWLDLATVPGRPAVRIDLDRPPGGSDMTARPATTSPGEHLLHTIATRLLLLALEFPQEVRLHPGAPRPEPFAGIADGLGDAVAALEACGALSPLSPVPGQLAALCASLNVTGHGITAPPARDVPEPWLSMLAHYYRMRPPKASDGDGCAAVAAALPELDGIKLTIVGLHNSADRTVLFAQAAGVRPEGYDGRRGVVPDFPLRVWVRDSSGLWHATRARGWAGADHAEATMGLQVLPPLNRAAAWIDIFAAGPSAQVLLTLPLRWQ